MRTAGVSLAALAADASLTKFVHHRGRFKLYELRERWFFVQQLLSMDCFDKLLVLLIV